MQKNVLYHLCDHFLHRICNGSTSVSCKALSLFLCVSKSLMKCCDFVEKEDVQILAFIKANMILLTLERLIRSRDQIYHR